VVLAEKAAVGGAKLATADCAVPTDVGPPCTLTTVTKMYVLRGPHGAVNTIGARRPREIDGEGSPSLNPRRCKDDRSLSR